MISKLRESLTQEANSPRWKSKTLSRGRGSLSWERKPPTWKSPSQGREGSNCESLLAERESPNRESLNLQQRLSQLSQREKSILMLIAPVEGMKWQWVSLCLEWKGEESREDEESTTTIQPLKMGEIWDVKRLCMTLKWEHCHLDALVLGHWGQSCGSRW